MDYPFFFTWTAQSKARPLELAGGAGAWFTTQAGDRWLDLGSLIYQVSVGHGHARMVGAVKAQADRLCVSYPGAVYPEKIALAKELLAIAPPGFAKVFFTLGGSDANENAIKIARMFTGRHKLVARYRSYHGATMGAVTLSGDWRRPPAEPGIPGVAHVLDFDCPSCPGGTQAPDCTHEPLTHVPRTLELEGEVGAVFMEAVVGGNGVLIPPKGAMRRVRDACDRHGALLVADEVLTGFGRTGRWLGLEHWDGAVPDMITLGKAVTGGYGTLGAVLVHERVAKHFDDHVLVAGLTHYAHPLAIAAGLEAIRVTRDEGLVENAARLEPVLREGLEAIRARMPERVLRSRVIGLLSGTDLEADAAAFARLSDALKKRRVHAHVNARARALVLAPPLCIREDELGQGLAWVEESIREALS